MKFSARLLGSSAILALSFASIPAHAQNQTAQAQSGSLEEIVVTAQRREQSLQTVPIAITALSAVELEKRQITKTIDIVNFVPNMQGSNNTGLGTANTYSLRALNNTESIPTFDPPVGTYVDDVYISRQNANNFGFFDVERVEILRGPQGTLFGRNTTGGAVNVIIKKPQEDFGGYAEVGYGRFKQISGRASVDIPINEKVLTKFSAYYINDDGYVKNLTTGERLNDEESQGYRAALRLKISDDLTWDSSLEYIDTSLTSNANIYDPATGDRITRSGMRKGTTGTAFTNILAGEKRNYGLHNTAKVFSAISNFEAKSGDNFSINFITGFRGLGQEFLTDRLVAANTFATGGVANATDGEYDQFSQEIKATGSFADGMFEYVAGAFYISEDNITDFADNNSTNATTGVVLVGADRVLKNKTDSIAGYTQFDFNMTDQLKLTAGIRYTDEKKSVDFQPNVNPRVPAGNIFNTSSILALGIPVERKTNVWTPRFAIDFQATDSLLVFASATKGFKSGGWNARGTSAGTIQPFNPEIVWNYETGVRSDWFDNRLRINATGYYMDVAAFQIAAGALNPATNQTAFITGNFADLENYGLEVEAAASPIEGLNITAALGLQDAKYKNPAASVITQLATCRASLAAGGTGAGSCNVGIVTPTGQIGVPTRAPEFNLALGVNYAIPVTDDLQVVPSVNARRTKGYWLSGSNAPQAFQPGYWRVNAGISLESTQGWELAAECENCFGETVITAYLAPVAFLDDPSRWTVRAKYKF